MSAAAAKAALREEIRALRAARSEAERGAAGAALAEHVDAVAAEAGRPAAPDRPGSPGGAAPLTVAAFAGVRDEPPTLSLLDALLDRGVRVLLPILRPDMDLDWGEYAGTGSLQPARLGLLEPIGPGLGPEAIGAVGLALVPALAVDRSGRRLGQGGGSYDRALPRVAGLVLAVVFDDEVLDAVPAEPHDRRVDGALTPGGGLLRFG